MPERRVGPNALLAIIVLCYLVTGAAYAWLTPIWETPDEPAHYNYVRHLVHHKSLPVLEADDYDFAYLEQIKAAQFPPDMSIDSIRYEFHQPPLYYVLGAVLVAPLPEIWWPLVLRMLSVVLGGVLLVVAYLVAIEIFPQQPAWALGAAAFTAVVPMHVAMTAAVNNDTLAELLLGLVLLALVRRVIRMPVAAAWRSDVSLGVLIGLGLLTKTTTYITLPLALIVILTPSVWQCTRNPAVRDRVLPWKRTLVSVARVFGIALAVGALWFVRNSLTYGGFDMLGMGRHNSIMLEQPHTADWLARLGWGGLAQAFVQTTFRSFWAQFGWMGVLIDERLYLLLGLFSLLVVAGFILFLLQDCGGLRLNQKLALGTLGLSFLFTAMSYLWYNIQFVQHQGRYLFPALLPLALGTALGVWKLWDRRYAGYLAVVIAVIVLGVLARGWLTGSSNKWLIALLGGTAITFGVRTLLPACWQKGFYVLTFLGLWVLDWVCLLLFVVPYFQS